MPSNFKALAGASGGEPTDANFKNVTLLLHGDGSNGAQNNTFIDSSTNNFTITRNGNTTQGSFSPYGSNWSNYFDGSGDYLTAPYSVTNSEWWTQDFTMEMWVYNNTNAVSGTNSLCLQLAHGIPGSADTYWAFGTNASGQVDFYYFNGGGVRITGTTAAALNTWNHIAMVYTHSSGNISLYLNGSRVATGTKAGTPQNSSGSTINVGVAQNTFYNGYISNLRILDGTALYSGTTYTVPTAPLTAITNTSLLTCAYNRFRDGSTNNFTITRNGDVKVTNFAPFAPSSAYSTSANGGSGYFDGSGDYLSAPSNTALDCGTGNWTIECWTYISTRTNSYPLVFGNNRGGWTTDALALTNSNADNASYNDKFVFGWNNGGFISPSAGNSQLLVSNVTNELNTWHHLALVRNGTSIKMYRNGVEVASATILVTASFNWGYNGALVGGGNWDGAGSYYNGYISNLRLVKGTAVYTAAFTPPSAPVTAITNTSLLINAANAAIFDNSMKNDLETVGNAQISTSVKKFGTGSMYFDGTGDFITMPSTSDLSFGSGNFTIEGWVYRVGGGSDQVICDFRSGTGTTIKPCIFINSSNQLIYLVNGSAVIVGGTIAATTWTHVALSKSGSSTKMFINGTQTGSTYTDTNDYGATSRCYLGADDDGGQNAFLNGYIDDLRVTKGIARYTANFTAPTAAFPNK